jgi:hypothetical protein
VFVLKNAIRKKPRIRLKHTITQGFHDSFHIPNIIVAKINQQLQVGIFFYHGDLIAVQ